MGNKQLSVKRAKKRPYWDRQKHMMEVVKKKRAEKPANHPATDEPLSTTTNFQDGSKRWSNATADVEDNEWKKEEENINMDSWRKTTNRYCAVWGCLSNSRRNSDLSYFSLPQDPDRAQAWLEKIQREMPTHVQSMRVCEKHFEPEMVGTNKSRKRLMTDAVPTLYLPDPSSTKNYPMEFLTIEMNPTSLSDDEDDQPLIKREKKDVSEENNGSASDNQDSNAEQCGMRTAGPSAVGEGPDGSMDEYITDDGDGEGGGRSDVGRMVDSSQADDRKMIRLVRERRLLYARNNMPVASYYSRVKGLWNEVAHEMGWTVADVRRKWSHIRNSYSRHLRNEMHGARTGKGRMVSRWYLADELEFLREHMATDIELTPRNEKQNFPSKYTDKQRPPSFSTYAPTLLDMEQTETPCPEPVDVKPFIHSPWFLNPPQPVERRETSNDDSCSSAFEADENSSYFQFFRGIHNDYQDLPPKKQRLFKRKCLDFLHELLDEDDQPASMVCQNDAINLTRCQPDSNTNQRLCVVEKLESFSDSGL